MQSRVILYFHISFSLTLSLSLNRGSQGNHDFLILFHLWFTSNLGGWINMILSILAPQRLQKLGGDSFWLHLTLFCIKMFLFTLFHEYHNILVVLQPDLFLYNWLVLTSNHFLFPAKKSNWLNECLCSLFSMSTTIFLSFFSQIYSSITDWYCRVTT